EHTIDAYLQDAVSNKVCSLQNTQDRGALNGVVLEGFERAIGVMQRKNLHVRLNRDFSRHAEEILAILPRVVGYTSNHPLLVQQVVGERRNRTHMNSAEHQHAAFLQRL